MLLNSLIHKKVFNSYNVNKLYIAFSYLQMYELMFEVVYPFDCYFYSFSVET